MISFHSFGYDRTYFIKQQATYPCTQPLPNNKMILIRPIRSQDTEPLRVIYNKLSPGSKYMRFNTNLATISPCFLNQLTQQIAEKAHHNGFGLLAYQEFGKQTVGPSPIGLGCYIETAAGVAELEISIADRWQNKGLGSNLFQRLVNHAKGNQVEKLEAYVNVYNVPMKALIAKDRKSVV